MYFSSKSLITADEDTHCKSLQPEVYSIDSISHVSSQKYDPIISIGRAIRSYVAIVWSIYIITYRPEAFLGFEAGSFVLHSYVAYLLRGERSLR